MALIDEMRRQEAAKQPQPNSFGDAAAAAQDNGVIQVGQPGAPLGSMHSAGGRSGAQMLASGIDSGARSFFESFQKKPEAPAASASAAPAAPVAPNPTDQRLAAGTQTLQAAPASASTPAPAAPVSASNQAMPGVFQHGRGQYSDQADGMGFKAGFTGQPNAQNLAAADNMSGRQGLAALAAAQPSAAPATGAGVPLVQAAGIRHSGNDWQARNDLRNAQVSASSIMNNGGPWDRHGKGVVSPERAAYQAMLGTDQALRMAQPGADTAAMQANAGLQGEGMRQAGANQRSLLQHALDQQRVNQDAQKWGYTNRAAGLVQHMREQVAAEQDQTKRKGLVQHMLDVEGRTQQADPFLVVPGGQHIDPASQKAYNTPSSVFNRQTQQWVQQPGQGAAVPAVGTVQRGYKFKGGDPASPSSWERA